MSSRGAISGVARVKATTVRVRDHFVLARFGKLSQARFREAASPELRQTFNTAGDQWVDFVQFVEATQLCCDMFADGDVTLSREIGAYGAESNMGVWRSIVHRVLSPSTVMSIAAGLWSHHYEGGRLVSERRGSDGLVLRIENFPCPHRTHCLSIEGWILKTLMLGRPKRALVKETGCRLRGDAACEYEGEWS